MKVAIIGSGGIAGRHLQALAAIPDVEIVGHVTQHREHAAMMASRWGGQAFTDHRALLESVTVDAAWICVPPFAHGDIERALIERRVPFLVEKPLDADCSTAASLASAIREADIVAGVAYQWRAMDTLETVRDVIRARPARLVLGSWLSSTPPPPWWHREAEGGGQIVEQATHLIDLARHLVGEAVPLFAAASRYPREQYPGMDVSDVTTATVQFHGGAIGAFAATCLLPATADVSLRLACDGTLISITQESIEIRDEHGTRTSERRNDPLLEQDRAFLRAVEARNPSLLYCDYEDALRTHRLCCAIRDLARATGNALPQT